MLIAALWRCMLGRGLRGSNCASSTLCRFLVTPSATHNQIELFWCWCLSGWVCAHSRTLWVSPTNSPVRLGVSPAATSTPTGVFNQRFEALFPRSEALGCAVCLAPQLFLPVYPQANEGPPSPLAATLLWVPSAQLPVSTPPTGLDECFFISLVVGVPYISIFCQFWLFFVFKLLLSFWLCEEVQCVYLCLRLGWKFLYFKISFLFNLWNTPVCLCVLHFVYPLICWWTLGLLPPFASLLWIMLWWLWVDKYMFESLLLLL